MASWARASSSWPPAPDEWIERSASAHRGDAVRTSQRAALATGAEQVGPSRAMTWIQLGWRVAPYRATRSRTRHLAECSRAARARPWRVWPSSAVESACGHVLDATRPRSARGLTRTIQTRGCGGGALGGARPAPRVNSSGGTVVTINDAQLQVDAVAVKDGVGGSRSTARLRPEWPFDRLRRDRLGQVESCPCTPTGHGTPNSSAGASRS